MDDIALLKALGYTLSEIGAILDKNGAYVPSVEHNGRLIESAISKEYYDKHISEQSKLKEIGFKYNVDAEGGEYFQQQVAIAKHKIKKYEKDTLSINKPNFNDKFYILALEEIKKDEMISLSEVKIEPQKENEFGDYITIDFVLPIVLLLLFIFIIFKRSNQIKTFWNQLVARVYKLDFSKKLKYYVIVVLFSSLVSTYLGFKHKTFDFSILRNASMKDNKWQSDLYLEAYKSDSDFFSLSSGYGVSFAFNWEWFIVSFLTLISLSIFIRNTIYYDKIIQFFTRIKR